MESPRQTINNTFRAETVEPVVKSCRSSDGDLKATEVMIEKC
jgi:hypothetical protein